MRKTFHLCISSHDEVMFRCREDYIKGFNCFAEAILDTAINTRDTSIQNMDVPAGIASRFGGDAVRI